MTTLLDAVPVDVGGTAAVPPYRDDLLCDTMETQELLDNFFALYGASGEAVASTTATTTSSAKVTEEQCGGMRRSHSPPLLVRRADDDDRPIGRMDDHHAQQSQYVPVDEGEEEEEAEDADNDADDSEAVSTERKVCFSDGGEEVGAPTASPITTTLAGGGKRATATTDDAAGDGVQVAVAVAPSTPKELEEADLPADPEGRARTTRPAPASPTPSPAPRSNTDDSSSTESVLWPFAHPPPPEALPAPHQTRAAFHTKRYGAFIKAYLGLSDAEVRQAERRGRGICMIGVRKVTRYNKGTICSPNSFSFASTRQMPTCKEVPSDLLSHPFRFLRSGNADPVRTQRVFLRHSVLAVEGDAVFCQLIDRAETLYAVEQQRLDRAAAAAAAAGSLGSPSRRLDSDEEVKEEEVGSESGTKQQQQRCSINAPSAPVMYPQFRKLPRVSEPYLRPNARCIALHYGLPDCPTTATTTADGHEKSCFPRATLIAVVSTTRLEENAEIYVSMDSYYRCLDEVGWYRRCYSHLNARYGCSDTLSPPHTDVPSVCGVGDVYTGVKRFPTWPPALPYYHGVGRRHASDAAEGAFPFTLVDLDAAPELGEGQKGVVASLWIPYGTCLLYCGPSVATRKVEKLVTKRLLIGQTHSCDPANGDGHDGIGEEEEEDLSFAMDDTYALGLGRHGVCFGQGLTRYINHRYNTARFGNVELCSVMLSVPSEFGAGAHRGSPPKTGVAATTHLSSDPSLTDNENHQLRTSVRKQQGRRSGGGSGRGGVNVIVEGTSAAFPPPPQRGKRKAQPQHRRPPRFYLEEKSFFVTVPFFLATTDIPPGASLLAWTYGEDYDARLERHAVADGHIVPYADAAVLNRRLTRPPPACRFQRYSGDYRFAVGVGDVVWRRRPFLASPLNPQASAWTGAGAEQRVPLPEEDLFVVVQTQQGSVEQVLLQLLTRVDLEEGELEELLRGQCLIDYVSPHTSSFAVSTAAHAERPQSSGRGKRQPSTQHRAPAWSVHWAVFQLPDSAIASEGSTLPLARAEDALRRCVVATVESVGLLLPDVDYSVVQTQRPEKKGKTRKGVDGGSGGPRLTLDSSHRIIVNLDDLHHATHLVRTDAQRATAVPALLNGLLWPLFSSQVERGGNQPLPSSRA
jgi:hypothetical protein